MRELLKLVVYGLIASLSFSCSLSNATIEHYYIDPNFNQEKKYTIGIMPISNKHLSPDETDSLNKNVYEALNNRPSFVNVHDKNTTIKLLEGTDLLQAWQRFWENHSEGKEIDDVLLIELESKLKADLVIQGEVLDIKKTFGVHREVIGETSAKVKFAVFSIKERKLLWKAICKGIQQNAHSDQTAPKPIEAVEIAFDKIMREFPFN